LIYFLYEKNLGGSRWCFFAAIMSIYWLKFIYFMV